MIAREIAYLIPSAIAGGLIAIWCSAIWLIYDHTLMTIPELLRAWGIATVLWYGWTHVMREE